jgi:hypothetical protein
LNRLIINVVQAVHYAQHADESYSPGKGRVRRSNGRLAGGLLTLLATLFLNTAAAQDAAIAQDTTVSSDITVPPDAVAAPGMPPIGWQDKLRFHAVSAYGPSALAGAVAYDGFLQAIDYPREWGQSWPGYSKRVGSTLAYSGIRNLLGFGLDSALHQDPRYYRSTESGMWRRSKHAFHETIFTHKDSGGETLATWRLGSAYGAAFISNEWYPDRVNTVALGFSQGSTQLGFDLLSNLGSEFWPDIKRTLLHRKP